MMDSGEKQLRVELHLHTIGSHDSLMKPQKILDRCDKLGIDRIAVTDHDVISIALEVKAMAPDRVIVGEEIQTNQGEIIGYFMKELIPGGLDPMETIERLRAQGAVISIPHPFDALRTPNFTRAQIEAIAPYVDALETFNARCISNTPNLQAEAFVQSHGLLETVGSDAHSFLELGKANLVMGEFHDAETFLKALRDAQKITKRSSPFVHIISRFAKIYKRMSNL
jgi:predicted metal-dependent phosphoesterase TrpH